MPDLRLWDRFVYSRPGRRFLGHYRRSRQAGGGRGWKRIAFVAAGVAVCLAGVFFMAVPGPGLLIFAAGVALIARESAVVARLCDRAEVRLRRLAKRVSRRVRGWRTRSASRAEDTRQTPPP